MRQVQVFALLLAITPRVLCQTATYKASISFSDQITGLQIRDYHSDFYFITASSSSV